MPLDTAAATKHLRRADPVMRDLIKRVGSCGLKPGARGDHFTTLLRAIIGQQLSAKAAETIWLRVVALHPNGRKIAPEDVLAMDEQLMRGAGMSKAKVAYAKDLATHVADGRLKLNRMGRLSDEEIVTELVAVNGIGRWTAEMFMMFRLGRPDVWAIGDLGLRNAARNLYGIEPTKANLEAVAEPWRPWRSVASWYLWRGLALTAPSLGRETKAPSKVPV
jgi:DNA-3-methyladenine glycosylase II